MAELNWSDAQWQKVNDAVTETFGKVSVASAFLPCYGPLSASSENVKDQKLTVDFATPVHMTVGDDTTLKLFNLTVMVALSSEQYADESLSSALLAFRRAASTLAQVEDDIVFNGFTRSRAPKPPVSQQRTQSVVVSGETSATGLTGTSSKTRSIRSGTVGEDLVAEIAAKIAKLEGDSHPRPFACVLGKNLFVEAHRPSKDSMVLPADRITPLLGGPLLRSGEIRSDDRGVVVALGSGAVDIVVATPPKAQLLQVTPDAKYLFRVYEKFVLRIKDAADPAFVDFELK